MDGNINKRAAETKEKQLRIKGTSIDIVAESNEYDPKNVLAFIDAVAGIAWAPDFCEIASGSVALTWADYWICHARQPVVQKVKRASEAASWKLAMEMRNGATFEAAPTRSAKSGRTPSTSRSSCPAIETDLDPLRAGRTQPATSRKTT